MPPWALTAEIRHNVFLAFKEALHNVLKHAAATEVRIGLALNEGKLTLLITDNGCGFSADSGRSTGNGLANMRQRLERIGGQLMLDSRPGAGTRIRMEANGK